MSNPRLTRRGLIAGSVAAPALAGALAHAEDPVPADPGEAARRALEDATGAKLVILGSGAGPTPGRRRQMTSHVMLSGGAAYVLDFGLGVTDRLARIGVRFNELKSIFLTHHHPDHNIELGPLLVIGWLQGMPLSTRLFGPPPLQQMTADLLRAHEATIDFWMADHPTLPPLRAVDVHEISSAGPVMQDGVVRVSAVLVHHPPVTPALGYRFDFHDRSFAFSGDTTPLEAVARMARGADVLVHEAILLSEVESYVRGVFANGRPGAPEEVIDQMRSSHSPVEDVGRIAQEAGVKTLVLSHLAPALDSISDDEWRAPAAKFFEGEIIVARDLMVV